MKQVGGDHYERCAIQPWAIIRRNGLDYWEGTVLKYLLRHKRKNGKEDLLKLQHFLSYMIEHYGELYVSTNTQEWQFPGLSAGDFSDLQCRPGSIEALHTQAIWPLGEGAAPAPVTGETPGNVY